MMMKVTLVLCLGAAVLAVSCGAHPHGNHHGHHEHHKHGTHTRHDDQSPADLALSQHKQCRLCVQNNNMGGVDHWFCPPTNDKPLSDAQGRCVPAGDCSTLRIDTLERCPSDPPATKATCFSCLLDGYVWNAYSPVSADPFDGLCSDASMETMFPVTNIRTCPENHRDPDSSDPADAVSADDDGPDDSETVIDLMITMICVTVFLFLFFLIYRRWKRRRDFRRMRRTQAQLPPLPPASASTHTQPFIDHNSTQSDALVAPSAPAAAHRSSHHYVAVALTEVPHLQTQHRAQAPASPVPGAPCGSDEPVYDVGPTVAPVHYVPHPEPESPGVYGTV